MKHRVDGAILTPDRRLDLVPVQCAQNSKALGWRHLRAEDYPDLPASDIRLPGMDHHLLVFHYKALKGEFQHDCAGRKTRTVLHDGDLSFIPAGADNRWFFGIGGPSALHMMVPAHAFDTITARDLASGGSSQLCDYFQVASPSLAGLARLIRLELDAASDNRLYVDTLTTALCQQILGQFSDAVTRPVRSDKTDVSAARDLIEDESARALPLDELADLCGLSRSQLVRSFRKTFGIAPHQYQMECRINRARAALNADRDLSLATLASDLGFSDQSHFNRVFKSHTGQTPGRYLSRTS